MKKMMTVLTMAAILLMMACSVDPAEEPKESSSQDQSNEVVVEKAAVNYEPLVITTPVVIDLTHVKIYKPDLVPGENSAGAWPLHVQLNSDGTLTFYVLNKGYAASTPSYAKIYLYTSGGTYIHYKYVPALNPGQKVALTAITPPIGWYNPDGNFKIVVDYFDSVDELNESNNTETGAIIG